MVNMIKNSCFDDVGCDVRIVGSGSLSSPGYGTSKSYPDLMECSWTLYAPSEDRSVTVVFEDFDLEEDVMMVCVVYPLSIT